MPSRFDVRMAASALADMADRPGRAFVDGGLKLGAAQPFSFDLLKETARRMAQRPYAEPNRPAPEIVEKIDYDAWGSIKFRPAAALYADGSGRFPVEFFHLGMFFPKRVEIFVVEGRMAWPVVYDPRYFDMPADSIARLLPEDAGFAGFRFQEPRDGKLDWHTNDWVAFLGASYFRAIGELHQYGISARAVALDVAVPGRPEEFPDFTRFYIEMPPAVADGCHDTAIVHALLEGPSIVGACRFAMTRGEGVVMEIEQVLHLRAGVARLGVAPLTSMYWFSETRRPDGVDWRPEVHDSDGLALWTGAGERIWRPLNNPERTVVSSFLDDGLRGFGLLQRDRSFDHYQDGVFYDRRPSLWVEPLGAGWGRGAVMLVEIPTDDEVHDNIVAMWVPESPAVAGSRKELRYRLHWLADEPYPTPLARCVATRLGHGGQPGRQRPEGVRKFLVEFLGGPLARLASGTVPEVVLTASRGSFSGAFAEAVPDGVPGHWRAQFDLAVDGAEPVEMRCFLRTANQALSETWAFQYHPF